MKNQTKNKNLVFPWDVKGYVRLSDKAKSKILKLLVDMHRFKSEIGKTLDAQNYWFHNFKNSNKINTFTLKKIIYLTKEKNLINEIIQFNDDKGSSSVPFKGKFPIQYNPLWHFIFCLSVGDGHIKKEKKKQFYWYQKPEGLKELIKLINKMDFYYSPKISTCKRGVCIPQLIRKIGSHITGLKTGKEIKSGIIKASSKLGREYQIALLMALFLDESGMSKPRTSEITLHQESNLLFLQEIEKLLNDLGIRNARNKKGNKWVIRLKVEGIIKLSKLFKSLNVYGINLLHRQDIFDHKTTIAGLSRRR